MKIAYIIIAHSYPSLLKRLIETINDKDVSIYVHIDKKSSLNFNLPDMKNLYILKEKNIYWGGFSFVEAVISLINKAISTSKFDYMILLSGSDYPIRSNSTIKNFLKKNNGKEFINISRMPENNKTLDRIYYYYLETDFDFKFASLIKRSINRLIRLLNIKRKLPSEYSKYTFYGGSAWWALSDNAISYISNFIKQNPKFVNFYKHTLIPDELFFQTILGNSKFKDNITNSITYTCWTKNSAHPNTITKKNIWILEKNIVPSDYGDKTARVFFARKFSDLNVEILNLIDLKLRK